MKFAGFLSLLAFGASGFELAFHPPNIVGYGFTYCDRFAGVTAGTNRNNISTVLGGLGSGFGIAVSNDGGKTWVNDTKSPELDGCRPAGLFKEDFGGIHCFGDFRPSNSHGLYKNFSASSYVQWTSKDGALDSVTINQSSTWTGFPLPVTCEENFGGCPMRLSGSDIVRFSDGTYLYSPIVYWGGNGKYATSVVAFSSQDGLNWDFKGVIANASSYPSSQEGPNENALTILPDGRVMCVVRLDAGDGPETHPYKPYFVTFSSDKGATWSDLESMGSLGSARPKILNLCPNGGPLILSGGRARFRNTSDILLWRNDACDAKTWVEYSITYWHNHLESDPSLRFTPLVNTSSSPRQTSSYTSTMLVPPSSSSVQSTFLITYDRYLGDHIGFSMLIDVIP